MRIHPAPSSVVVWVNNHPSRRRGRHSLATLLLGVVAVCALAGCGDQVKKMIETRFRHSPDFAPIARTISLNPDMNLTLGSPFTIGELKLTAYDQATRSATIDIPVSGPKASGHAVIHISEPDPKGPFISQGGDFFPVQGPPIRLPAR